MDELIYINSQKLTGNFAVHFPFNYILMIQSDEIIISETLREIK